MAKTTNERWKDFGKTLLKKCFVWFVYLIAVTLLIVRYNNIDNINYVILGCVGILWTICAAMFTKELWTAIRDLAYPKDTENIN